MALREFKDEIEFDRARVVWRCTYKMMRILCQLMYGNPYTNAGFVDASAAWYIIETYWRHKQ